jgi:hypothetical protein
VNIALVPNERNLWIGQRGGAIKLVKAREDVSRMLLNEHKEAARTMDEERVAVEVRNECL